MIEAAARLCQLIALPRSTGQIYGLLYLSPSALSLDDMVELLRISKASASTATRQLASLRAIRQVWVQGDRRDYFEAEPDISALLRIGYTEFLQPRLKSSRTRLERMSGALNDDLARGRISEADHKLCSERLKNISALEQKFQALAPLAEKFL